MMSDELGDDEVPRDKLLSVFLEDEALNDISLKGSDGVKVLANRGILGAKSRVFRQLLYGNFAEASSPIIDIKNFEGNVLQAVVEYVHIDTAKVLENNDDDDEQNQQKRVHTLVKLYGAGVYFNLPGLCKKTRGSLSLTIKKNPSLSFALLEAAKQEGPSIPEGITEMAKRSIRSNISGILQSNSMELLSPSVLEEILTDEKHHVKELELFKLLQKWANQSNDRRDAAMELSKNIRLEMIDPIELSESVTSSGLVSQSQLLEAFKTQALALSQEQKLPRKRARMMTLKWKYSQSDLVEGAKCHRSHLLDCPEITSGIHQWTMEIEERCKTTWLGIAHTGYPITMNESIWQKMGGWAFAHNGSVYHNGAFVHFLPNHPNAFTVGSMVTLRLDLRDSTSGTLSACIDNREPFFVTSGLRSHLEGREGGFVPAVSVFRSGDRVRILKFEEL